MTMKRWASAQLFFWNFHKNHSSVQACIVQLYAVSKMSYEGTKHLFADSRKNNNIDFFPTKNFSHFFDPANSLQKLSFFESIEKSVDFAVFRR